MFRAATVLLAKAKTAAVVRPTHVTVSPYAVFLVDTAKSQALAGLEIGARANAAGKLWHSLPKDQKLAYAMKALKAEPYKVHKGLPRNPPPFARYVKQYWASSPSNLAFEDRVCFLAEKFHKSVAARAAKKI